VGVEWLLRGSMSSGVSKGFTEVWGFS